MGSRGIRIGENVENTGSGGGADSFQRRKNRTNMRRRKSRGTWLPTQGTVVSLTDETTVSGRDFSIAVQESTINTIITSVTFDEPFDEDHNTVGTNLATAVGGEYLLRRIVGKFFATRIPQPAADSDLNPAVLVGAGFFVARAVDSAEDGSFSQPLGAETDLKRTQNFSPLEVDTIREPWIWRRTWILGTSGARREDQAAVRSNQNFPASTALYGSVADGPHIDAKTARRISNDDRLWFAVSATPWPAGVGLTGPEFSVDGYLDYRLFGSLRRARNHGQF